MYDWAEFRHFRYLLTILEKGGFRIAADELHTSQPNLTVQARQFQDNASIRLFRKSKSGRIYPTRTGQAPTKESSITRKARLANGSWIFVTFSTTQPGKMPFGSDRCLLFFLLDKAVKNQSRFVIWETASEYLEAMNLAPGGTNRRATRERFERIRRLMIYVERPGISSSYSEMIPMIRRANLPESLLRRDGRSLCISTIDTALMYCYAAA